MVVPQTDTVAWDADHFKYGCVFAEGYANPIKPIVDYNEDLEEPDTIELAEDADKRQAAADGGGEEGGEVVEANHVELISSPRYRDYMRQDLISQLLNPREQWKLIAYGVIALAILMVLNVALSAAAAGLL